MGSNTAVMHVTTPEGAVVPVQGVAVSGGSGGTSGGIAATIAADDTASHGTYTLSATPGTVTSIAVPSGARIVRLLSPSANVDWNVNADAVAAGTNALTAGGFAIANETTAIILRSGAATLRLSSSTASATIRVEFRG